MSIRDEINLIYQDNIDYNNPNQAINQASSLEALSDDLYTEPTRFIYELLQNADDASVDSNSVEVWIKLFDNILVVAHSGKTFDKRDLHGICSINNGTKKNDISKTGYKGIGFKSVFGQSDKVIIYTNGEFFRFDRAYDFKWRWENDQKYWEQENDRTFQYPWQIIPIYTCKDKVSSSICDYLTVKNVNVATIIQLKNKVETTQAILKLAENINMFLFLKKISMINCELSTPFCIEIDRTHSNSIKLSKGKISSNWLLKRINLKVPDNIKSTLKDERNIPDKLAMTDYIELAFAAKVDTNGIVCLDDKEKLLYSYLPTSETRYALPVLVNTSFLTSANRETLHIDSKWNQWLFESIPYELFKWIAELAKTELKDDAYKLIPKYVIADELGNNIKKGIEKAIKEISFIISSDDNLIKVKEAIVDFTNLSKKTFVGGDSIKQYIEKYKLHSSGSQLYFTKYSKIISKIINLGASTFELQDLSDFIKSDYFKKNHTVDFNIELIKYLKQLCESEEQNVISKEVVKRIPFIWDHKNHLNYPARVCFPAANDKNWDNPDSQLLFLHKKLQDWLRTDNESRQWLESLGTTEKTDTTYIYQNIIPKIHDYITIDNAVVAIRDLFSLYVKEELNNELLDKLSEIKLLTSKGSLKSANECFLSSYYNPRLLLETMLDEDIYIAKDYCNDIHSRDKWKEFFIKLGAKEGIYTIHYDKKMYTRELLDIGFYKSYFSTPDKFFKPWYNTFQAESFSNIISLNLIHLTTKNNQFAVVFWTDIISNYIPCDISKGAIAYWGHMSMLGQTSGDSVMNYVPWFIQNNECIPTKTGKCETSSVVILNSEYNVGLSGNYLPIFEGPDLQQDWRAFFNFRSELLLSDYLNILSKISLDIDKSGHIQYDNIKRVQDIYGVLLSQCLNWSNAEITMVHEWANNGLLLNSNNGFSSCNDLYFFIDGNEMLFQGQYNFIKLSKEVKINTNIETLLNIFNVKVLKQDQFKLQADNLHDCISLHDKLYSIKPYFLEWIIYDDISESTNKKLLQFDNKLEKIRIHEADSLKITYHEIDFTKNVSTHYDGSDIYLTSPWEANSVLIKLPEILCNYFGLKGHDKKLEFLLRSKKEEIISYFKQEDISIPEECELSDDIDNIIEISNDYHHDSIPDPQKAEYIHTLISRSVKNVINYLKQLREYDCSRCYPVSESVIGGILKNGNEITVVARPSDDNHVILYYQSEFDVLEYVDAEFWCEDGINLPHQITLGYLLKRAEINRIPLNHIGFDEVQSLLGVAKSEVFEFNAVPDVPEKIAILISSFSNTKGGTIFYGVRENLLNGNEIVGLSSDFEVESIVKSAISMLSPLPNLSYEWMCISTKHIFTIKIEKSEESILLRNKKYVREDTVSKLEDVNQNRVLYSAPVERTIAIIIAIENYADHKENTIQKVKYALDDATLFKNFLIDTIKVDESNIYTYYDSEALKSSLEYDMRGLFNYLTEKDRLIFYFVGHGFHNGVTNYLSTYDMHQFNISETAISLREVLLDPLCKSKCNNAFIFIDACAQSIQDINSRDSINNINDNEFILLTDQFPHYAVFLSCQPGQKSYSSDVLQHGIWTHHLVKALGGMVPDVILDNKYITDRLLNEYLSSSVSKYVEEELRKNQDPRAIIDSNFENIIRSI